MSKEQNTPTSPTKEQLQPDNASRSTQEPIQGEKPKKWLTISLIIFALAALIIVGVLTYQNYQLKKVASKTGIPTPSPVTTGVPSPAPIVDPTANWLTYTNENICYTFKYPKEVTLNEENIIHLSLWGPTQKKDTEFYDGISLTFSLPLKIGNSLKEYVDSKIEEGKEVEDIVKMLKPRRKEITINRINGYTYTTEGAFGTSQKIFLQSLDKTCTVKITNATNDPTNQGYQQTVDKILSTFKFVD